MHYGALPTKVLNMLPTPKVPMRVQDLKKGRYYLCVESIVGLPRNIYVLLYHGLLPDRDPYSESYSSVGVSFWSSDNSWFEYNEGSGGAIISSWNQCLEKSKTTPISKAQASALKALWGFK